MQYPQKKWRVLPCSPPITGAPDVIEKAVLGNRELRLNALDVIR
jgi:hypothetical protein